MRLNKLLAERGVASRRHADELIASGRVRVDGQVVRALGTDVAPGAAVDVDGRDVPPVARLRYVALHKPAGILSSARSEHGRPSVADVVGAAERLYPVGRLDADSEGLVLLSNDGDWAQRVIHPRYGHEREYEVYVAAAATAEALARLRRGIRLEEGLARAVRAEAASRGPGGARLRLVLRTGWKRQVRRMCAAAGLRVRRLVRVRIGPVRLGTLRPGAWRELTAREVRALALSPSARFARTRRAAPLLRTRSDRLSRILARPG